MITNPTEAQIEAALTSMEEGIVSLDLFLMADAVMWWARAQLGDALAMRMVEVMPSVVASVKANGTACLCCDRMVHEIGAAAIMSREDSPAKVAICYQVCVSCADLSFEDLRLRIIMALGQFFSNIRLIRDDLHSPGHA